MALRIQVGFRTLLNKWKFQPKLQNGKQLFIAASKNGGELAPSSSYFQNRNLAIFGHIHYDRLACPLRGHYRYLSTSSSWSVSKYTSTDDIVDDDANLTSILPSYDAESHMYPSWGKYSGVEIANAEVSTTDEAVIVNWRDGGRVQSTSYPLVWLRDNCRCPECFSPAAKSRKVPMKDLDTDCSIEKLYTRDKSLIATWNDGHRSQYPARWLRCNAFSDSEPDPAADLEPRLWDAATCRDRIRTFDFSDLLNDDGSLFDMLREIKVLGITMVANTPQQSGQIQKLGHRVGYLTRCNYGETFHVHSRLNPASVAYTSGYLPLHTDQSYYNHPPGIQLLHFITQADGEGGENLLVDGFKIASDLRENAPELYHLLTKEVVEFFDIGADFDTGVGNFYQHSRNRVIRLDHRGNVDRIVFSDHARSAMTRMRVDDVTTMYRALTTFATLLYDPINVYECKPSNGDILIMDNHRVLHGRQAYTMQPGSTRHLEGSYFEWDTAMSRLRVLREVLGATKSTSGDS